MAQSEPNLRVVAQLQPDTDAPDLGPLLSSELAKRSNCPSFGAFLEGHPECSDCCVRRACEVRLTQHLLTEASALQRLDNISSAANVSDLVGPAAATGLRIPTAVRRGLKTS